MPREKSPTSTARPGGKEPISFRLTPEAKTLIAVLARRLGVPQSAVLEMAVREFAAKQGK